MTKEKLLELKELFYRVFQFYYGAYRDTIAGAGVDAGEATEYIAALRDAEKNLFNGENELSADADEVLLYAVTHIKDALLEKDYRLAGDLSKAATRLCGVYDFPYLSRKRFWKKQVLPLREKHGEGLFSEVEEFFLSGSDASVVLSPSFSTKMRGARYYEEDSDAQLLEAHPVLYTLFAALGMLLFVGAIVLYGVCFSRGRSLDMLGYLGAALVGTGLFSLSMTFVHQYMGHKLTAALFALGAILALLASVL